MIDKSHVDEPSNGEDRHCDAWHYLANSTVQETWTAGGNEKIAWTIQTNHQGAIGFRLCPLETVMASHDIGKGGDTEACFQHTHLEFAHDHTCIRCPDDPRSEDWVCYTVQDVKGENGNMYRTWNGVVDGCEEGESPFDHCKDPTKNKPCTTNDIPAFSLVNAVKVPSDLRGKYVLGMRWDSAHTAQVWLNCAIIEIVPPAAAADGVSV